jgi:hypothetical protein
LTESREAGNVAPVKDGDPRPEQEWEKIQEEEVKSQQPPSWSSWVWVTFPRKEDNPAIWISDENGE